MIEIRRLDIADTSEVRELRLQALQNDPTSFLSSYEEERTYPLSIFEERLSQEHSVVFGAWSNHQLVGMVTLLREQRLKTKHIGTINAMYVSPSFRRQGIAKSLMQEALKQALTLGIQRIRLSVSQSNAHAISLYESLGFEVYGIEPQAIYLANQFEDMVLMNLMIQEG